MSSLTKPIQSDFDFLDYLTDQKPIEPPPPLISQYIQGRRMLPPGTPFPGPWDNAKTPYFIEIMDCMSPESVVQHVVLMKSRKVGATTMSENVVGYWIANPAPIEYVTATQELAKEWATDKLPALLQSLTLQERITTSNTENAKSRRTGDTTFRKEFFGGSLDITSFESKKAQRAGDKRILIRDEIDGVKALLSSGEGNVLEVNKGHTMSWGARRKILDFSSPTTAADSNIWQYYLVGDQRKYFVPCPYCQTPQELVFGGSDDKFDYALKPIHNSVGDVIDAVYICKSCKKTIKNHQKASILLCKEVGGDAYWQPTRETTDRTYRSYHISALYSPPDMFTWTALYKEYLKSIEDTEAIDDGRRIFDTIYLGIPFKESGTRPQIGAAMARVGTYNRGVVPDGVLYLTIGVDVQRGKDSRLELEVLGHGIGYRTWSIDYRILKGDTSDATDGAWLDLKDFLNECANGIYKDRLNHPFVPQLCFIDARDGERTETVYQFCRAPTKGCWPSMGQQTIRASHERKQEGDEAIRNETKYSFTRIGSSDQFFYRISTNHYKNIVYANIAVERVDGSAQRSHFCDFPNDYEEPYFNGLLSEEKRADGAYHMIHARNEPLDCRVYALAAGDVWLDEVVQRLKDSWKRSHPNVTKEELAAFNGYYVLQELQKRLNSAIGG